MGATGEGKTGRVNRVNLRWCLVIVSLADGLFERGVGTLPWKSGRRVKGHEFLPGGGRETWLWHTFRDRWLARGVMPG
jgi:hypothetical protein